MKAALVRELGGPDRIEIADVPQVEPGTGEVAIDVHACALNFFDTLMIRGRYQFKPPMPYSPGAEVAGMIVKLGSGVTGWRVGQLVIAFIRWNGCRERTLAKPEQMVVVPDGVDLAVAAGLTVTYGTAMHALTDRARLRSGETLAVLGAAGGAGLAALEIGKLMGARIIAVASSPDKLALCKARGADELIDYSREDLKTRLRELTDERGADVVYDCVGGEHTEAALRSTAWFGRLLIIGFAAGEIPRVPMNIPLLRSCSIVGVAWGVAAERDPSMHQRNMKQILDWVAEGTLRPHIHKLYPLEETRAALEALDQRGAKGKVVVKVK